MNNDLKYVIYTHSEYDDILRINLDYSDGFKKILFINNDAVIDDTLKDKFESIIFYDGSQPYGSRIYNCLNQLDEKYILFSHDIDIPLSYDIETLNELTLFMSENKIDRVDLQQDVPSVGNKKLQDNKENLVFKDTILIRNNNPNAYIYNVNPSIWNKNSFTEIVKNYQSETYRTIETSSIQSFSIPYNIYKCHHDMSEKVGWFYVTPLFKYLHITHNGHLLPITQNENNLSYDNNLIYQKIINKYDLENKERPFSSSLF